MRNTHVRLSFHIVFSRGRISKTCQHEGNDSFAVSCSSSRACPSGNGKSSSSHLLLSRDGRSGNGEESSWLPLVTLSQDSSHQMSFHIRPLDDPDGGLALDNGHTPPVVSILNRNLHIF